MYYLGIDIGTTNTKALLLSDQLQVIAESSVSYNLQTLDGGGVEQNPNDWWKACRSILCEFWQKGINPHELAGIAVSGHGCSLVVVNERGEAIRHAISSLDTRCKKQTESIRKTSKNLIQQVNGNDVGAFNFEPKLLWLKQNEPDHYREMPSFLTPTSYITFQFTGRRAVNVSDGGIAMAFDRRNGFDWSSDIIHSIGLEPEKFPPLVPCSEVIGTVTREAAAITGIPEGIPVIAGGEDTSSAALSVGITKPGMAYISLGTQGTVGVCTDQFSIRPEILGFPHVLSGLNLLSGSMSTSGAGLQWFVREWCKDLKSTVEQEKIQKNIYEFLLDRCNNTKPGADELLFLPYLSGELHPILDENASGVFFGLKLHHTREDMARAVIEGTAHAIRHNLSYAEKGAGQITELRAVGGPTRSSLWCQVIADITGCTVKVIGTNSEVGGAPLGNALLLIQEITGKEIDDLLPNCLTVKGEYRPSEKVKPLYDRHHEIYKQLYKRIKDLYPLMKKGS